MATKQKEEEVRWKMNFTAQSHLRFNKRSKRNAKITGCHVVTWFTRVLGHTWFHTKQPVYTLFTVQSAYVLGAADTWLGYISALVTKRHEPRGGNHGSRDFCQRCSPVIAKELSRNLKRISEQILFQPRDEIMVHFGHNPWNYKQRFLSEPGFGPTTSDRSYRCLYSYKDPLFLADFTISLY